MEVSEGGGKKLREEEEKEEAIAAPKQSRLTSGSQVSEGGCKRLREEEEEDVAIGAPKKSKHASLKQEEKKPEEKVRFPWSVTDPNAVKSLVEARNRMGDHEEKFGKWVEENLLGDVWEQRENSNICWAIAVGQCVQGFLNSEVRTEEEMKHVSIPYLIDNVNTNGVGAVTDVGNVFEFIVNEGVMREEDYKMSRGKSKSKVPKLTIDSFQKWPRAGEKLKEEDLCEILKKTPIVAVLRYNQEFRDICDSGGIYRGATLGVQQHIRQLRNSAPGTLVDRHTVLIVGWGISDEGVPFWLFKNSWGTTWGVDGYGKLIRRSSSDKEPSVFESVYFPVSF